MRRIRYSVAMSLDGYIAGPQGEAEWIVIDPEIDFKAILGEFDTVLIGGRSFAAMTGDRKPGKSGGKVFDMKTIVVSRTIRPSDYPGVTVLSSNLKEALAALKAEAGRDIWLFGGGLLFRTLLEIDMVDSVEVAVIPVLLGTGVPLLPPPAPGATLHLLDQKVFSKTGTVWLSYAISGASRS